MANEEHLNIFKQGVGTWNRWREDNSEIRPDLSGANLSEANLTGANLDGAGFYRADLSKAELSGADLSGAYLKEANLVRANLSEAVLFRAKLIRADLSRADLFGVYLIMADLSKAKLIEANLMRADLSGANLSDANLTSCCVYGISAWGLKLERAKQLNLVITPPDEPAITMDNLEVAQFIYLLLKNQKIRDVIGNIATKAVLLLGRFTLERNAIFDMIRDELRRYNYLPIWFDCNIRGSRNITEAITPLARMARFIIADLTEPSTIPKELEAIVPTLAVPVQPLLQGSTRPYSIFKDSWKYRWVLKAHWYQGPNDLLASLKEKVITPAEGKAKELE